MLAVSSPERPCTNHAPPRLKYDIMTMENDGYVGDQHIEYKTPESDT